MSQITVEEFRNFFKYYKGEEHQMRAVDELYQNLDLDTKITTQNGYSYIETLLKRLKSHQKNFSGPLVKSRWQQLWDALLRLYRMI